MNCGQEIRVQDTYGATAMRFIAQCEGRFMLISHTFDHLNGYMLADWRGVLRELVAAAVPAKLIEKTKRVEGIAVNGLYIGFPLTYPLSVKSLADLLGVPADEVRAQLADLAVEVDP